MRTRRSPDRHLGCPETHLKQIEWDPDGTAKRLHLRHFPAAADEYDLTVDVIENVLRRAA